MSSKKLVPHVDVKLYTEGSPQDKKDFVRLFGEGLKEFGFVVTRGHGIESTLIRTCYDSVAKLFKLSVDTKRQFDVPGGKGQRGYTGFGKEHAKTSTQGDLKEFWHVGRERCDNPEIQKMYPSNVWPDAMLREFKPSFLELYSKLDGFASTLLEATSEYLHLPRTTLPKMVRDGNSILRLLHYPPLAQDHFKSGAVRAAAHEDINFITILCEATESGLQLLTRDGKWLDIESGPGDMVIDSGDMLSRITNDLIPSTTHRVINPPNAQNKTRYSMPFFVHAYPTCPLVTLPTCVSATLPPKHHACTADEFLQQRLREIGLT